jgi:hypothetical protein
MEEHSVVTVYMPATEEMHLPAAMDDLSIGEIGAFRAVQGLPACFPVEW